MTIDKYKPLLYGENFAGQVDLVNGDYSSGGYTFQKLFSGSPVVEAKNLILPALTLSQYCYSNMFLECIFLITAPSILPATKLADRCYYSMFAGCTSLTTAPELPATTLANDCYGYMFSGCTSLTESPELPSTTLVSGCYYSRFSGCNKLNYIKMLATDISAFDCLGNWVDGETPVNAENLNKIEKAIQVLSERSVTASNFKGDEENNSLNISTGEVINNILML